MPVATPPPRASWQPDGCSTPDRSGGASRALTPAIGVVLMLAVTVTIVAIAVPLVLTESSQVTDDSPTVDLAFSYTEDVDAAETDVFGANGSAAGADADGQLTILFESGDSVSAGQLEINGTASAGTVGSNTSAFDDGDDLSPGTELTVWADRGDTVQLIWTAEDGDEGAIIGSFTVRPVN